MRQLRATCSFPDFWRRLAHIENEDLRACVAAHVAAHVPGCENDGEGINAELADA